MRTRPQTPVKMVAMLRPITTAVPAGLLQRKCACGGTPGVDGECTSCRARRLSLQKQAAAAPQQAVIPPIVHEVLRAPGQPLDPTIRAFMEPRFGHDFSLVRVHTDSRAAESARAVNALAYTVGRDVVFGAGQYALGADVGRRLLAHELTHVVQQREAIQHEEGISSEQHPSEQEAEIMSERSINGAVGTDYRSPLKTSWMHIPGMQRQGMAAAKAVRTAIKEQLSNDPYPETPTGEQIGRFTLSDNGFDFLVRHEGVVTHLYNDSAGHCTIGVGHLVHQGNCNGTESTEFKADITRERALELFRGDVERFEEIVHNNVEVRINQAQYDALVSFTFNTGRLPETGVLRELNLGMYSKVPGAMMQWVKPPELKGRRTDEANLFRTGNYGP